MASLESLEELAIADDIVSLAGLQSLLGANDLKALHIQRYAAVTEATLAEMPKLETLTETQNSQGANSPAWWEVLHAFVSLKKSEDGRDAPYNKNRLTTVTLDHGDRIFALESEVDALCRALDALRRANPGIVIDSDPKWFDEGRGQQRSLWAKVFF